MSERLRVNPIACDAHGLCAELLPELVRLDEWGYPVLSSEVVPPRLLKHARRAVAACPTLALLLEPAPRSPAPSPQGNGKTPDRGGRGREGRSTGGEVDAPIGDRTQMR
jgi:ferredoxin